MTEATQIYLNPTTFAVNTLRYFVAANGKHVVARYDGADVDSEVFFLDTIEEARKVWRALRTLLTARGYTDRLK